MSELPLYCFSTLHQKLIPSKSQIIFPSSINTQQESPLFVSWFVYRDSSTNTVYTQKQLRGCIGSFSPQNLIDGLGKYSLISALKDSRFSPITYTELVDLSCAVSILKNFEKRSHWMDWEVGTHGIWIEFMDNRGSLQTATYLPEVCQEQGWTKIQAIDSLLRKGGFRGKIDASVRDGIVLTRYISEKTECTYEDWEKRLQEQQQRRQEEDY